jgi:hypothetical protein
MDRHTLSISMTPRLNEGSLDDKGVGLANETLPWLWAR